MEQLLTANVATSMYWLGRDLERIESTLHRIDKAYDQIIDVDKDAGADLFKKFNIELEYTSALDFLDQAIRGDHSANLVTIMQNARENAIISRPNIDSSVFGEIIELNELFQGIAKSPLAIDYQDIDTALSLINEILGAHAKRGHRRYSDYFMRLGRLVEEVDFRLRFDKDPEVTLAIIKEIDSIFKILDPAMDLENNPEISMMDNIYQKVDRLIVN